MSIELDYLASLARNYVFPKPEGIKPPEGLAWDHLFDLCDRHHCSSALLPQIQKDHLPHNVLTQLETRVSRSIRWNTLLLLELERVIPHLEEAGCVPTILKGGALGTCHYSSPTDREMADLDILVHHSKVDLACAILAELGYSISYAGKNPKYYKDYHFHWIFQNPLGVVVEIHWAVTMPDSIYHYDIERLFKKTRLVPLNDIEMRVPSDLDMLLLFVLQGTAGRFGEIRLAMDAALLLKANPFVDGSFELAQSQNLQNGLWLLIDHAAELFERSEWRKILGDRKPYDTTQANLNFLFQKSFSNYPTPHLIVAIHWFCVPGIGLRLLELFRFLFPGERAYLELGPQIEAMPKVSRWSWVFFNRLRDINRILSTLVGK